MNDDKLSDATKAANERSAAFVEAVRELKRFKPWAVLREEIEFRIRSYEANVMKPVNDQSGAFESERFKGSALALRGLLKPFDSILPEVESSNDDS